MGHKRTQGVLSVCIWETNQVRSCLIKILWGKTWKDISQEATLVALKKKLNLNLRHGLILWPISPRLVQLKNFRGEIFCQSMLLPRTIQTCSCRLTGITRSMWERNVRPVFCWTQPSHRNSWHYVHPFVSKSSHPSFCWQAADRRLDEPCSFEQVNKKHHMALVPGQTHHC